MDAHFTGFQIEVGAKQHLDRNGMRPERAADLDAHHVVPVELVVRENRVNFERLRQDARLEEQDGVADTVFELEHVDRRGGLARQRRQSVIDDRSFDVVQADELVRLGETDRVEQPRHVPQHRFAEAAFIHHARFSRLGLAIIGFVVGQAVQQGGLQAIT